MSYGMNEVSADTFGQSNTSCASVSGGNRDLPLMAGDKRALVFGLHRPKTDAIKITRTLKMSNV